MAIRSPVLKILSIINNKSDSVIKAYIITKDDISLIDKLLPEKITSVNETTKVHQVVFECNHFSLTRRQNYMSNKRNFTI